MYWNQRTSILKRSIYSIVLCFCLICTYGCSIQNWNLPSPGLPDFDIDLPIIGDLNSQLEEVPPPELIQQLKGEVSTSTPRIEIVEPRENITIDTQSVEIKLLVSGLDLYKDSDLGLGLHIAVILDDQAPLEIYDVNQPIIIKELKPGSHTIRAIAEYPWNESFKNPAAYAQRSFNILTSSHQNMAGEYPILTVSSIQNTYSNEPLLLDFVVRQAAAKSPTDTDKKFNSPKNLQVKATLNDQSFVIEDADASLYLKGIKDGQNWLKLELEDNQGKLQPGPFSEQTFGFQFSQEKSSAIGKIFSEEMSLAEAGGIVGQRKVVNQAPTITNPQPTSPTTPTTLAPTPVEPNKARENTPTVAPSPPKASINTAKTTKGTSSAVKTPTAPKFQTTKPKQPEKPIKPSIQPPSMVDSSSSRPSSTVKQTSSEASTSNQTETIKNKPPIQAKSEASDEPTASLSAKVPTPKQTLDSTQSLKTKPEYAPSERTDNPMNNKFQSFRQSSQRKTSQGLDNWRDPFRKTNEGQTSTSKLNRDVSSPSIQSSPPNSTKSETPANLNAPVNATSERTLE